MARTDLLINKEGGLLDSLINKGSLPTIKTEVDDNTILKMGATIIIVVIFCVLSYFIIKKIFA